MENDKKRTWSAPELVVYGDVEDLTQHQCKCCGTGDNGLTVSNISTV